MTRWRVCVVSTSRADYGCLNRLMHEIRDDPELDLQLVVMGSHWAADADRRARLLTDDGLPVSLAVDAEPPSDDPEAVGVALGRALQQFAAAIARLAPHVVVVLGDRYEVMAPALAALVHNIPLAHLHGGELSLGAIDDSVRHALTKLARLHFVATARYGERVIQMGEPRESVFCVGAPALDGLSGLRLPTREQLAAELGVSFEEPVALVTYHPVTQEPGRALEQVAEMLAALQKSGLVAIITTANADVAGQAINGALEQFVRREPGRFRLFSHLGQRRYFGCLRYCAVMIGNSSSGLIEAPSFEMPVVNIGNRQEGRIRAANVIDAECEAGHILAAVHTALQPQFRDGLRGMSNPYDPVHDGRTSRRIKDILKSQLAAGLTARKRFQDAL